MCKSKSKTYTTSEIAKHFNVNISTVTRFAQKHNIQPVKVTQNNAKHYYINDFSGLHKNHKKSDSKPKKNKETVLIEQLKIRLSEKQNQINDLRQTIELLQKQLVVKDEQIATATRIADQAQQLDLTTHKQQELPENQVKKGTTKQKKHWWNF